MRHRDAEIEDVGVRIERVGCRHRRLGRERARKYAELHIAAAAEDRQMRQHIRLDEGELVALVARAVEQPDEMRVARVRSIHRLEGEAEIEARGIGVERLGEQDRRLVQHELVGPVVEQVAKIGAGRAAGQVAGDAAIDIAGDREGRRRLVVGQGGGCHRRGGEEGGGDRRYYSSHCLTPVDLKVPVFPAAQTAIRPLCREFSGPNAGPRAILVPCIQEEGAQECRQSKQCAIDFRGLSPRRSPATAARPRFARAVQTNSRAAIA